MGIRLAETLSLTSEQEGIARGFLAENIESANFESPRDPRVLLDRVLATDSGRGISTST